MIENLKWALDPAHSEITFKVRHLMISNVKGEFRKFDARLAFSENNLDQSSVHADIDAASVSTNNEDRDKHLRSADFFDTDKYPKIEFKSELFQKKSSNQFELRGALSLHGVSHPITLEVEYNGSVKDPYGNDKVAFSFSGKLNRKDFGLNWNSTLETGGVLVGDEVKFSGELQFVKS